VDKSSLWATWQNGPYKTHRTSKNTKYTKNFFFVFYRFLWIFLFSIFNYLQDFSKKCWITALARSMKNIGGLNHFSLQKTSHFLNIFWRRKRKKMSIHSFKQGHKFMSNVTTIVFLLQMQWLLLKTFYHLSKKTSYLWYCKNISSFNIIRIGILLSSFLCRNTCLRHDLYSIKPRDFKRQN